MLENKNSVTITSHLEKNTVYMKERVSAFLFSVVMYRYKIQ